VLVGVVLVLVVLLGVGIFKVPSIARAILEIVTVLGAVEVPFIAHQRPTTSCRCRHGRALAVVPYCLLRVAAMRAPRDTVRDPTRLLAAIANAAPAPQASKSAILQ